MMNAVAGNNAQLETRRMRDLRLNHAYMFESIRPVTTRFGNYHFFILSINNNNI